ncbi:death-on-curing protein [Methylopila jiangsuensis]|uniref:Death-on-curing protein n=1 Tax=Methylopila jiangsuensis TaxID=586230 RepID=A0A9W6N3Y9_9HYPH|nr:type II toxin-antitoxin system death-on-curing family toxin [Methylopila jiangsuensis]MDR6286855.1 death-on-curing protein [Methylopila jiangsuensis]GLK76798.1 death-on-curing protein [Methylopila jiangsuensis]
MSLLSEPFWLDDEILLQAHDWSIAIHGGLSGLRDVAALESALARPRNKWAYGETDLFALAASYGFGLARNHPFADGNKRAAYMATRLFLERNGSKLAASEEDKIKTFLALAAGTLSEDDLAAWLRARGR